MLKEFNVTLDISKHKNNPVYTFSTSDWQSLKFLVTVQKDGISVDLTGITPRIAIKKTDKTTILQDGTVTDAANGKCEFLLTSQAYVISGPYKAEVMLYEGTEQVATTSGFTYMVSIGVMNIELESKDDWPTLSKAIEAGENEPTRMAAEETRIANENDRKTNEEARQISLTNMGVATENAATQALYAKAQGDYAKAEADRVAGMDVSILTTQLAENSTQIKNEWLKNFSGKNYSAHKGYNGRIDGSNSTGVEIQNSLGAYERAGRLGFNMMEIDLQILKDGTWIVAHDNTTLYTMSGTTANFDTLTLAEYKARTMYREYLLNGNYWVYSYELTDFKAPTAEEALQVAKKYNMYCVCEIKVPATYVLQEQDFASLAGIIKKLGMEGKVIIFSGDNTYIEKTMAYLPNAIAGYTLYADVNLAAKMKTYKNYLALISKERYNQTMRDFCKNNDIPMMVWTVDDYEIANQLFKDGVNFVTTNCLIKQPKLEEYTTFEKYVDKTLNKLTEVKGSGTYTYTSLKICQFNTTDYIARQLTIPAASLKRGDIIKIKATGKTASSTNGNVARMYISNMKTDDTKREFLATFPSTDYETKEIFYTITDTAQDITVSIGAQGQGITGTADVQFRDVEIVRYSNVNDLEKSNERFSQLYAYDSYLITKPGSVNKGIKGTRADTDTSVLIIDYEPFLNFKGNPIVMITNTDYADGYAKRVVPYADNPENGIVRAKVYDSAGVKVANPSVGLRMGFNIVIKNE